MSTNQKIFLKSQSMSSRQPFIEQRKFALPNVAGQIRVKSADVDGTRYRQTQEARSQSVSVKDCPRMIRHWKQTKLGIIFRKLENAFSWISVTWSSGWKACNYYYYRYFIKEIPSEGMWMNNFWHLLDVSQISYVFTKCLVHHWMLMRLYASIELQTQF